MNQTQLSEEKIEKAIEAINKVDFENISINDIKEMLIPVLNGYTFSAPFFDPGTLLFRGRVCSKPVYLSEMLYPPNQFIKSYGRLNAIGQPMFYGAIGKAIPFFELKAKVGDTIAMSWWKTNVGMWLNQVGFTDGASQSLNSNRELGVIYDFAKQMTDFRDVNTFIYNYLASVFTRRIPHNQQYLYKLSIAMSDMLLIPDEFVGMMYPTVAMFGNADNIALKPTFVDKHLDFLAIEFYEVTKIDGLEYTYKTLQYASEIDEHGAFRWTEKKLVYNIPNGTQNSKATLKPQGNEWIAYDENGALKPEATGEQNFPKTLLEQQYLTDFPAVFKLTEDRTFTSMLESFHFKATLNLDYAEQSKFLTFYIPRCRFPIAVAQKIVENYDAFLKLDEGRKLNLGITKDSHTKVISNSDFKFSGDIHFYSEVVFQPIDIIRSSDINIIMAAL